MAKKGTKICWLKIFEKFFEKFFEKIFFSFFLNDPIRKVKWLKTFFDEFSVQVLTAKDNQKKSLETKTKDNL